MAKITELFGSKVFNDETMRARLPKETYKALRNVIDHGAELPLPVANVIANQMKAWAVELGATHYTHWFQPLTGLTAEKHDSFVSPAGDGTAILEFSGKELIKGEPDASSLPSGGLRTTFEARGYTAWDPNSFAFVKDGSLYIPTAFCSYSGESLDSKTPLLRSMEAVSGAAVRILRLFGNRSSKKVIPTVGAEQEYFLIDRELYEKRKDLVYTGRTLFGTLPPKGQELGDHYFGTLKQRVSDYMKELDSALWELGVPAKIKHNEVAPSQHECAPIFESANIASDHNQLMMELMQKIARNHGFACLLHEKPFDGINGSGKHDNWSLFTDTGVNLLDPGSSPIENAQFLTFLAAVIAACDEYSDLIRLSTASSGNDRRLGCNEAPPAVVSVFLGTELTDVIDALINDRDASDLKQQFDVGVSSLPKFPKDTTDRNRTSPFAFTGNKFEFRMSGSNLNITTPNIVLNTIVAETLNRIADELEKIVASGETNLRVPLRLLLIRLFTEHKKIIFNGNGYDDEWMNESAKRGLFNLRSTADAVPYFTLEKNIALFEKHKVFTRTEIESRKEILLGNYSKSIHIEALTALDIAKKEILPAAFKFQKDLYQLYITRKNAGFTEEDVVDKKTGEVIVPAYDRKFITEIDAIVKGIVNNIANLYDKLNSFRDISDAEQLAYRYQNTVLPAIEELRAAVDALESLAPADLWPVPTYGEMLFSV